MPKSPRIPFVVEQMNLLTLTVSGAIQAAALFFYSRVFGWGVGAMIGLALAFIPLLVGLSLVPYNPFRGMGGHIVLSAKNDQPESDQERRLLLAFYRPSNRRRAATSIAIAMVVWVTIWQVARAVWKRPLGAMPPSQCAAVAFVLSIAIAGISGFFGLTLDIRRAWPGVIESGHPWPQDVKYPGPLKDSVQSFVTGVMPPFLRSADDIPAPRG